MTEALKNIHPAVARSLDTWHHMVASRDLSNLLSIVHPDAVFRSPMANTAYTSAPALMLALSTVIQVFEDFTYHRQLATDDGLNIVLEFSARVGDKQLKGIDLVRFNEQGQITEFEVMVRPLSGLQALGSEMGARLGDKLPAFKAKA
ncbi:MULTISPECIES: nuclear transport factor 2 family protein [unclassified Acidovorax]|uniref:nuclear transport factor 2 family protein n=1 Tax=unclassified Acidovorax TaxID=2684926 RepID=UPI001C49637F|nr:MULTISPECIES: nuclear transport factor 2 family protein [unclassified Acidovorax]MBV7428558.1 nuclear transport factor 2 family protein [Acidovorax sp. sif0732]MBV7450384.1 nuclear transport factor 2 family protein [Acidovorax sp. sif0715]